MDCRSSARLRCVMPQKKGPKEPREPAHSPQEKAELGKILALRREEAGLTQKAAGAPLGLQKAAISSWEKGINLPDALNLRKLAKVYGTTLDALAGHGAISGEAMELALEFDALSQEQRRSFQTLWPGFIDQVKAVAARNIGQPVDQSGDTHAAEGQYATTSVQQRQQGVSPAQKAIAILRSGDASSQDRRPAPGGGGRRDR